MAWGRPSDRPLSEPMGVKLLTHISVTRPQWVKRVHCFAGVFSYITWVWSLSEIDIKCAFRIIRIYIVYHHHNAISCLVTFKGEYKSCFWKPVYSCNVIYDISYYIRYGRQSFTMAHLENILLDNTPYWYWYTPILLLIAEMVMHAHRSYRYKAVVFI